MALISYLTTVRFGECEAPGDELAALGVRRPMVVTDQGVIAAGLLQRLPFGGAVVFDATRSSPAERATLQALAR